MKKTVETLRVNCSFYFSLYYKKVQFLSALKADHGIQFTLLGIASSYNYTAMGALIAGWA